MKDICILSDFDGTITKKDGLYHFFSQYAQKNWLEIEKMWEDNKINSKECLLYEFQSVKNLNEGLILEYLKTVEIDVYFKEFYKLTKQKGYDFIIVSDGVDYFINKILENNGIKGIKVISNHFEINGNTFSLTFPNENYLCKKQSGTCKCKILTEMKEKYKKVIYIGDATSDYCVCDKADILYAKGKLINFCIEHNIKHNEFKTFKEIIC